MIRNRLHDFTRNFSYTFFANILSLLISVVVSFVIPKLVSVENYGYYQLYVFYTSYVGVSYLGLCDGIYLRIGGEYYENLDKRLYGTQFRLLGLFEIVFYALFFCVSVPLLNDANKRAVIGLMCVAAVALCLRWFTTFILQATARIKEYALITVSERILYVFTAIPLVAAGHRGFKLLITADVAAKYVSMLISLWFCRDIVAARPLPIKTVAPEIKENISAGFRFMLAELSDMLIIGVVRFGIQNRWDVATFGKVSLTLSISNLLLTAINAVSTVLFPTLRRTAGEKLPMLYKIMQTVLSVIVLGAFILYCPIKTVLSAWLPRYAESIRLAAILFPVCLYQSKTSLLLNTYYKTMRLENLLMKCNIAALLLSVVFTAVSVYLLNSVTAAMFSILLVLVFRCILGEVMLSRHIDIKIAKDISLELVMTVVFIISNRYFGWAGMAAYAVIYLIYLAVKKNDIKETMAFVKSMA